MARLMSPCTHDNCKATFSHTLDIEANIRTSRYVLGHEAMKRMGSSNVLIVGLKGLGTEIGMYHPHRYS